jgi:dihydroorotase-like cyclic amidohydrolase
MPGVIDTAAAFDTTRADAWLAESAAAVTGGVTSAIALPSHPGATSQQSRKVLKGLGGSSWTNFALWGRATTPDLASLISAVDDGVHVGTLAAVGGESALGYPLAELRTLLTIPGLLALQLDVPTSDHPNIGHVFETLRKSERDVHLMHVSTSTELDLLDPLRGGLAVTAGVTPHHLFLTSEDVEDTIHTHPPIRPEHDRRTLWTAVKRGRLDCVASDHHVQRGDGVPGAELLFPLMLSAVKYGRLSLELLVSLCAEAPARILGLESKGRIVKGADADLVLFSESEVTRVNPKNLCSKAGWSPYLEREAAPKPELVIVGGEIVAQRGELVGSAPRGLHLLG